VLVIVARARAEKNTNTDTKLRRAASKLHEHEIARLLSETSLISLLFLVVATA